MALRSLADQDCRIVAGAGNSGVLHGPAKTAILASPRAEADVDNQHRARTGIAAVHALKGFC